MQTTVLRENSIRQTVHNQNIISRSISAFAVLAGLILFSSYSNESRAATAGCLDTTFNPGVNGTVYALAVWDGKILVAGSFTQLASTTANNIGRLQSNGSIDWYGFMASGVSVNGLIYVMAVQPSDGAIVIGGTFTTVNGVSRFAIARLTSSGYLDNYFAPSLNGYVTALKLQSDGKILIGGSFTTVGGSSHYHLARLNSDGTVDNNFTPYVTDTVWAIDIDNSSSPGPYIVIGGSFQYVNQVAKNRIARVRQSDAQLDSSQFPPDWNSAFNGTVLALKLGGSSSYRVFTAGSFTTFGGESVPYCTHLDNGGLRVDYNGTANATAESLALDGNGNILLGGQFTEVSDSNGTYSRTRICGLSSSSGEVDQDFVPPTIGGTGASVKAIAVQPNEDIVIGGTFTTINSTTYNRLARLKATCN